MRHGTYLISWTVSIFLSFFCLRVPTLAALEATESGLEVRNGHRLQHRHIGKGANSNRNSSSREVGLQKRKRSDKILLKGAGHATFYYEKDGPGKCGSLNGVEEYVEMKESAMCEPWRNPQKLEERNTNMIVALPLKMMRGNLKEYCGKEIIARYKDKTIRGLVAWDGCVKCDENDGLDFSSTVFGHLVGEKKCHAGRLDGLTCKRVYD